VTMTKVVVVWRCGHRDAIDPDGADPVCPSCGCRRVSSVQAAVPRVRAVDCEVASPLLETGR
jgi:ABC-type ATPase with predicted acetyltransferase domain